MSLYNKVKQFTVESGYQQPQAPETMNNDEVQFVSKMIASELAELMLTCGLDGDQMKKTLCDGIDETMNRSVNNIDHNVENQLDAFVDLTYYAMNACAKKKWDFFDSCFDEVHNANMNKRFPDRKFHRREDGKIIKPDGWVEPDLEKVISEYKF